MAATNPKESSKIVSLRVLLMKKNLSPPFKDPYFLIQNLLNLKTISMWSCESLLSQFSSCVFNGSLPNPKKKKKNIVSKTSMS